MEPPSAHETDEEGRATRQPALPALLPRLTARRSFLELCRQLQVSALGALAELISNAVDAGARNVWVEQRTVESHAMLAVRDDGQGLSPSALRRLFQLGHGGEGEDSGLGFALASMRLAQEVLVLTKDLEHRSVAWLSTAFLDETESEEVIVPLVTWDAGKDFVGDKKVNSRCLSLITGFSPFETDGDLLDLMDEIEGSGTLVLLWNLTKTKGQELELEFKPDDIQVKKPSESAPVESYSLKGLAASLFLLPVAFIHVQGQQIPNAILPRSLAHVESGLVRLPGGEKVRVTFGAFPNRERAVTTSGLFLYSDNRLVEHCVRIFSKAEAARGVIAIAEVSHLRLELHKEAFLHNEDYRRFLSTVAAMGSAYLANTVGDANAFWAALPKARITGYLAQCQTCHKWRQLSDRAKTPSNPLPDWTCSSTHPMAMANQQDCTTDPQLPSEQLLHVGDDSLGEYPLHSAEELGEIPLTRQPARTKRAREDPPAQQAPAPPVEEPPNKKFKLLTGKELLGARVRAYWQPGPEDKWQADWYPGTIDDFDEASDEYKVIYDYQNNYSWGSLDSFEIVQLPPLHNGNPHKVNKSAAKSAHSTPAKNENGAQQIVPEPRRVLPDDMTLSPFDRERQKRLNNMLDAMDNLLDTVDPYRNKQGVLTLQKLKASRAATAKLSLIHKMLNEHMADEAAVTLPPSNEPEKRKRQSLDKRRGETSEAEEKKPDVKAEEAKPTRRVIELDMDEDKMELDESHDLTKI